MTHPLPRTALRKAAVDLHSRELTREDLLGLLAISYLRFSSLPQEEGTSVIRQQKTLNDIVAFFGLQRDQAMEDRGFSASKRRHERFGQLGVLLKMVEDGEITPDRPIVLIIEATDRLFRSGTFDAMDVLRRLIRDGGMILVTGDMSIWNDFTINNSMKNIKLVVEINMAREYTVRLSQMACAAHAENRNLMEALVVDPDGEKPLLAGRPPAWIVRDNGHHSLHPVHAETVRLIFRLYIAGFSTNQIAQKLNADGVPVLGDKLRKGRRYTDWRATNVGRLLRDESVLGLVQPHHMVGGKRVAIGRKVKVYPHAIEAGDWLKVQEMLGSRQRLRGRKGLIANLFTGRVVCGVCAGAMRVDTGGNRTIRKFQCGAYIEGRSCGHATRYSIPVWEPLIVEKIIEHGALVPHDQDRDNQAAADLAGITIEMQQLKDAIAVVEPKIGSSPTMAERWEQMCVQLDALRTRADRLSVETQVGQSSVKRRDEVFRFIKEVEGPALRGDRDARERLRGLLSKMDYFVVFEPEGFPGVEIRVGSWSDRFLAE